jgi:hypothetical protein
MAILYNSNYDETVPFSDVCAQFALGANVEQTFTVPGTITNKYSARFGYIDTSNIFVRLNGTPTIPAGGTVGVQQFTEFRPGGDGSQRYLKGGDVVHCITPDATAYLGISLRSLP